MPRVTVPLSTRPSVTVTEPRLTAVTFRLPSSVTPLSVPDWPIRVAPLLKATVPPLIVPPERVSEALNVAVVSIERLPPESVIGS